MNTSHGGRNLLQCGVSASRQYQVTALILRAHEYGEGHRLYALLTREHGKILAVAKGIKKPKAKLASALQLFTLGEVELAVGKRFDVITHMRVLDTHYALRADLDAYTHACYFAELVDESLEERQLHTGIFDLCTDAWCRLARGEAPDIIARYVEISLIAMLGYLPHLGQCAHCHAPLAARDADSRVVWPTWLGFSASQGGALCPGCLPMVPGARRIAAGTIQVIHLLLTKGPDALTHIELSDRLRREIEQTLREYFEFRLERRLQSARFLRRWEAHTPEDARAALPTA